MSECVVRMEMPQNCEKCPACDYEEGNCLLADDRNTLPHNGKRRSWCPILCQLPEGHGRLVDENEVKDWVENWLCVNKYYHPYSSSKYIPVSEFYDVLQRMGEAVPAERSET